jgi:hypothetical protein
LAPTFLASALIENKNKRRKIEIEKKTRLIQPVLDVLACLFFFFLFWYPCQPIETHTTLLLEFFLFPPRPPANAYPSPTSLGLGEGLQKLIG